MDKLPKVGNAMATALSLGVPRELVVTTLMTNHRGKLARLLRLSAQRFLSAHQHVLTHPKLHSATKDRKREKALLDLVRYRLAALGARRPAAEIAVQAMDARPRLVHSRKAA